MILEGFTFLAGLAFAACGMATVLDLFFHRIPNWLTVGTVVIAFGVRFALNGFVDLDQGLLGLLAGFVVFFPFYMARWMAAGDVKLLMALGVCLGWRLVILAGLSSLLVGSFVAFGFLAVRGGLVDYLYRYWGMAKSLLLTGHFAYVSPDPSRTASVRFPYALAIALGTLAALYGPAHWSFMRIPILSVG